ncbi:hypothetical protein [Teredinibacter franksiae]|uniref:hypothetical protein n=1 Tax=Teredinibacter franksiae TaxID=2761453 RepID=UPI00162AA49C|nr:hypothetical protein [Teredinibacter franksiae]
MRLSVVLGFCLFASFVAAGELKPFTSDGCSAFPEGTRSQKELWLHCCTEHDRAYWRGGTYKQRWIADEQLRNCVANAGEEEIAQLMLAGVRVGGSPFWPTDFRWGYGWDYPHFYGQHTPVELAEINAMEKAEAEAEALKSNNSAP